MCSVLEEMKEEGMVSGKEEMVKNMLKDGVSVEKLVEYSGFSREHIERLMRELVIA